MANSGPIVHFLYEPGDGGLDRAAICLANAMAKRGILTELWLTRTSGPLADLIDPQVTIRRVPSPGFKNRGVNLFLQIPALARLIREIRPRAIFSAGNQSNLNIAIARNLSRTDSTKIIQKITSPVERSGYPQTLQTIRDWRFGITASLGDKTLVLSHSAKEAYRSKYLHQADKFDMVHLPCVTDEMIRHGIERRVKPADEVQQLLAAGRLTVQKDYPVMLKALALLKDKKWHLNILGDGPLREELHSMVRDLGLVDRVAFAGFVKDVEPYFADADMLLLSSRWEGLGAVAVEAYAMACPVATTECCGGLTDIIQAAGYKVSPVGDHVAYAAVVSDMLGATVDRKKLRQISQPYCIDNSVEEHLDLLVRLCESA